MRKYSAILLIITMVLSGCSGKSTEQEDKNEMVLLSVELLKKVEPSLTAEDRDTLLSLTEDLDQADGDAKKLAALMLATDLSLAQLGMVKEETLLYLGAKALEGYPEHPLVLNNVASVLFEVGRNDDAISLYREAVKAAPDNPVFLCNLANAYINKGDFNTAEMYAKQSLSYDSEYTLAYQILTTVYLSRHQDMLAAEMMIKSVKNSFNDVSMHQFDSFISEVQSLDAEDDFPLLEGILDELYTIIKQQAVEEHGEIDTPEGQLQVKSFPKFETIEAFIKSGKDFTDQQDQFSKLMMESVKKGTKVAAATNAYLYGSSKTANGSLPIRVEMKQIYAFKIMTAYYKHKFKQELYPLLEKGYELESKYYEKMPELQAVLEEKSEEHLKKMEYHSNLAVDYVLANNEAAAEIEFAKAAEEGEKLQDAYREYYQSIAKNDQNYFRKYYNNKEEIYTTVKQISEEYWLRSGGMLKYISDEDVFHSLLAERDQIIYSQLYEAINGIGMQAEIFKINKETADSLAKEYHPEDTYVMKGISLNPNKVDPPLRKFKEKNEKKYEISLPFISFSYKDKELTVKLTTPISKHVWKENFGTGSYSTASAYGVNPALGVLAKVLLGNEKHQKLQEKAWHYGINVPDKLHDGKVGQYITRDVNGRIVDIGKYKVKESSMGIPGIDGAAVEFGHEYMRSYITGIVEVERSKSLSFMNLSVDD